MRRDVRYKVILKPGVISHQYADFYLVLIRDATADRGIPESA